MNWDKHDLIIKEDSITKIWELKIPGESIRYRLTFINSGGVMMVTGDFGNFVFCREFHPSADGAVHEKYWLEKLKMKSCQNPGVFDADETRNEIEACLDVIKEDHDSDEYHLWDNHKEARYYLMLRDLIDNGCSEIEYDFHAYYSEEFLHSGLDNEDVPKKKKYVDYLETVFDGFDEICIRLKGQQKCLN